MGKYETYTKDKDRFTDLVTRNNDLHYQLDTRQQENVKLVQELKSQVSALKQQLSGVQGDLSDLTNRYQTLIAENVLSKAQVDSLKRQIDSKTQVVYSMQTELDKIVDVVPEINNVYVLNKNEDKPMKVKKGNMFQAKKIGKVKVELGATQIKVDSAVTIYLRYYIQPNKGEGIIVERTKDPVKINGQVITYSRVIKIKPGHHETPEFDVIPYEGVKGEHKIEIYYKNSDAVDKISFFTI